MSTYYHTTHCAACHVKLGEQRQKVLLQREEPYSQRHPTWYVWRSRGTFYLCDECMCELQERLEVDA